jgi:hypothetical protein
LIKQLKFASVQKGLFSGKITDQVISILNQSYSSLRIIYMTVIIKMYHKIPLIMNVAPVSFQHPTHYPLVLLSENLKYLFALLPGDQISKALHHISKKYFALDYSYYSILFIHEQKNIQIQIQLFTSLIFKQDCLCFEFDNKEKQFSTLLVEVFLLYSNEPKKIKN